jgi:hypothetical protein
MNINKEAFETLKSSINKFNDWKGINAKDWGKYFYNDDLNIKLNTKLTRSELLDYNFIKDLNNEEFAIAILSWGGMNREHGKSLFQNKEWLELIEKIKSNQITTREEGYALFTALRKNKKLKGMGPAYFTKLICFVNPSLKGYIMDQWTSKSINLLFENKIVALTNSGHVADKNSSAIYEDFCLKIEFLADLLKLQPIDLEENLFSNGGFNKGKWRQFVVDNWNIIDKSKAIKKVQIINYVEMEPINFEDALYQLKRDEVVIPTLGGRSKLIIKVENDLILITNSKNSKLIVANDLWEKVMNRMSEIPQEERGMSSRYSVGNNLYSWKNCPNRDAAYLVAIVKYFSK